MKYVIDDEDRTVKMSFRDSEEELQLVSIFSRIAIATQEMLLKGHGASAKSVLKGASVALREMLADMEKRNMCEKPTDDRVNKEIITPKMIEKATAFNEEKSNDEQGIVQRMASLKEKKHIRYLRYCEYQKRRESIRDVTDFAKCEKLLSGVKFLQQTLACGSWKSNSEILNVVKSKGISKATFVRAKRVLGVESKRVGKMKEIRLPGKTETATATARA